MRLIQGDCLEVIDKLIEKGVKVDCIITDPPYNLIGKNGDIHLFRQDKQNDRETFTKETMGYDVEFNQLEWLRNIKKILKKGGSLIIFNDWENMGNIAKELRRLKFKVKGLNHWQKTNPLPNEWRRRFVTGREYFLHAVNGGNIVFNVDKVHKGSFVYPLTPSSEKKHGKHPNQKPIVLIEELIKILTDENQTVLDCFMGSGTTGVACRNLNRKFIGIELNEKYFELAKQRIEEVTE